MHAHQLVHPWHLTWDWARAHRRPAVLVIHHAPRVLPEHRSHYYPSRCRYLESAAMSRAMYRL
ncbi:hypothetical protein E4P42_24415 [Mycobacterium sp. PS03-16]|uniref:hypothetical protein n=1 Tax=Mycobacterium sp. PS03-16 TaxID=2559611 RepID=UPI001074648A|nr:hypothetical protein [Mycobacterium sp. PS03-16]TFV54954.1 hypothetical protein E4P42_24415 [Mycobacterium sp. PS03-16]